MHLYYGPGSCALSPHIVAREANLPVGLVRVDISTHMTENGEDYYAINPKGAVPALALDSGEILTEGVAIVQYLADQAPVSVMPERGSLAYYRVLEWLTYISSEFHKSFGPVFRSNLPEEERAYAIQKIAQRFAYIDGALAGKQYLVNDTFSVADAYCYTILRWAKFADIKTEDYPNVQQFMDRMHARQAVQTALKDQGIE